MANCVGTRTVFVLFCLFYDCLTDLFFFSAREHEGLKEQIFSCALIPFDFLNVESLKLKMLRSWGVTVRKMTVLAPGSLQVCYLLWS